MNGKARMGQPLNENKKSGTHEYGLPRHEKCNAKSARVCDAFGDIIGGGGKTNQIKDRRSEKQGARDEKAEHRYHDA